MKVNIPISIGELFDKITILEIKQKKIKDNKKKGIDRLIKRFDPKNITENIPGSLYVAYSVNKGEELSICLREKETEKFMDQNTITFVAIHELAHIMSVDTGHTKEFWTNFKFLLNLLGTFLPT